MLTMIYALVLCALQRGVLAQIDVATGVAGATEAFEAQLVEQADPEGPRRKGTVHGFVVGDALKLMVAYRGASATYNTPHSSNLFRGDPLLGGSLIQNLALALSENGGFQTSVSLTTELAADLRAGLLYIQIRTDNVTPAQSINGPLVASTAAEFFETGLTGFVQGYPVARGAMRVFVPDAARSEVRIVGYFNALASNWTRMTLKRGDGRSGSEEIAWLWNTGESHLYGAIDQVVPVDGMNWPGELAAGRISVVVETSRAADALHGRFRPHYNTPPPQSRLLQPAGGSVVIVGGGAGEEPVASDLYLGTVTLDKVDDPDGDEVEYYWQMSTRPGFSNEQFMTTIALGVDSTVVPLSMRDGAALFDALVTNEPGGTPFQTPVTVLHRVVTSDGARYTVGPVTETTWVRGTITSRDEPGGTADHLRLVGNYPNPFALSTSIVFSLPATADVRISVFDLLGRVVADIDAGVVHGGTQAAVTLDGSALPTGAYFYRVTASNPGGRLSAAGSLIVSR